MSELVRVDNTVSSSTEYEFEFLYDWTITAAGDEIANAVVSTVFTARVPQLQTRVPEMLNLLIDEGFIEFQQLSLLSVYVEACPGFPEDSETELLAVYACCFLEPLDTEPGFPEVYLFEVSGNIACT